MANTNDPVVQSSRREAVVVGLVWLVATLYTAGYCTIYGYGRTSETIGYRYGFPDWFFWGILVPWGVCTVLTWGFAFWGMRDDVLGADTDFVAGDERTESGRGERDV